jgi:hypothetical protein
LIVGCLGVWRVTHLLHAEDGPWNVFSGMRKGLGRGVLFALVDCFYCLSLWIAIPFALGIAAVEGAGWGEALLLWPALSAGAIVTQRYAMRDDEGRVAYHEDPDTVTDREEH